MIRFCRAVSDLSGQQPASLETDTGLHQHSQRQRLPGSGGALNEERRRRVRPVRERRSGPDQVRELMIVERFVIDLSTVTTDFAQERPELASQVTVKFRCCDESPRNEFTNRSGWIGAVRILSRREHFREEAGQAAVERRKRGIRNDVAA